MKVEPLTGADLNRVSALQPEGWDSILPAYNLYASSAFAFPFKVEQKKEIAGIGTAIVLQTTGWLAHIIVHPDHWGKGIGQTITKHLVTTLQGKGCKTLSLVATALGERVYRKLGFQEDCQYVFLEGPQLKQSDELLDEVCDFQQEYQESLLRLDKIVSGEIRDVILLPHLQTSKLIIRQNIIEGYYLPSLGDGMIVANTPEAGLALLKYKHLITDRKAVLPEANTTALEFLQKGGFTEVRKSPRMFLGRRLSWKPEGLFSRIGGNLG